MPLKPVIKKLDDVEEAHRSLYEPETDNDGKPTGSYIVSISKENGYELHNSEKLMGALNGEREANRTLKSQLSKFEGVDPDKFTAMTAELEQLKSTSSSNKKVEELVEERIEPYKAEIAKQLDVYKAEATAQIEERENKIKLREEQLHKHLVSDYAMRVASDVSTSPSLMVNELSKQLRADLDGDTARVVILDENGNPRFSKEDLNKPISEAEWISGIKSNPEFAPIIKSESKPGTNSPQTGNRSPMNGAIQFSEAKTMEDKKAAIEAKIAARGGG